MQCRRKDSNLHEHRWLTRPSTQRVTPLLSVLGAVPCKVKTLQSTPCNIPKWLETVRGVIQGVTRLAAHNAGYGRGLRPMSGWSKQNFLNSFATVLASGAWFKGEVF